ncbi:REP-associated tyrosine transposase [Ovoidimarina sediminis]|uniref:REP-associated tyrosine transposase n=1 Tax=Ovoidimarina sediminis TaxID=3079856 RepID=UPI00292E45F2|nr:transposase [Rhodophyticola sp. MJ-SS7]
MSVYIRPRRPGATIFFTVTLAERGGDLLTREIGALRDAVRKTRAAHPFRIEAWVVMPDHLHAVWTLPEGDTAYSTRWGAIKARFTRAVRDGGRVGFHPTLRENGIRTVVGWNPTLRSASKLRKGDAGIWQRRFWEHHIRDAADFRAHVEYCWFNPVKHGFVEDPGDWPYSSYRRDRARFGA